MLEAYAQRLFGRDAKDDVKRRKDQDGGGRAAARPRGAAAR